MEKDFLAYYNLENYLFDVVRGRFHREGKLGAFDLLSIVIWKANRAKSTIARRLARMRGGDLEAAVEDFTSQLFRAGSMEERLQVTIEVWGFYLPMASAILTVLWPDEFTVFDIRVLEQLKELHVEPFKILVNVVPGKPLPSHFGSEYLRYRQAVEEAVEDSFSLREKDRFLWGKSAAEQLERDIQCGFVKARN